MSDTPRIYVADLAAYNAGTLHGVWIDVSDVDTLAEEVQAMLRESPCQGGEWAIHDHEGFHGLEISEYESLETIAELGELLEEYGPAYAAYVDSVGAHYATPEGFQETYRGEWDSEEAYAEELFEELYAHEIPEHLQCYIDYEAFARDIFIESYFSAKSDKGVYVFDR